MIDLLHHVGIVVRDADAALAFYRDVVGLPVVADSVLADQGVRAVLLTVGENELELLSPTEGGTGVARFLENRGETVHHLCFRTDNIVAELARLDAQGVELIDREPRLGLAGQVAFIHPRAMSGVLVELAQLPVDAHACDAKGFDRVGVRAFDFEATAALWHDVLGLSVSRRSGSDMSGIVMGQMRIGRCLIELLSPSLPDTPLAREIELSGEGVVPTVALEVADVDVEVARLRALGVELDDAVLGLMPGVRCATISAAQAFGVTVQILAYE